MSEWWGDAEEEEDFLLQELLGPRRSPARSEGGKQAAQLMHRYGLTPEEVLAMADKQLNQCAICQAQLGEKHKRHIDHDHKTGKVRALLCAGCNTALGRIEMVGVEKFAAYLKKHESEHE